MIEGVNRGYLLGSISFAVISGLLYGELFALDKHDVVPYSEPNWLGALGGLFVAAGISAIGAYVCADEATRNKYI